MMRITPGFSSLVALSPFTHSWSWHTLGIDHAKRQITPSSSASCEALNNYTFTDTNNIFYYVQCGSDLAGYDLQTVNTDSYQDCFGICDLVDGCQGFSYLGGDGPGRCYLKSNLAFTRFVGNVDCGYKRKATNNHVSPDGPKGSCSGLDSDVYKGTETTYIVDCGIDRPGGDLSVSESNTFEGCFGVCDNTTDCVGFMYLPGSCYLKQEMNEGTLNSYVDSAYRRKALPR